MGFSIQLYEDFNLAWTLGDGNDGTPVSVVMLQGGFVLTTVSWFTDYIGAQCYRPCCDQSAVEIRPPLDTTLLSTMVCRGLRCGCLSFLLDSGPQSSAPAYDRLIGLKRLHREIDRPAIKNSRFGDNSTLSSKR